MLDYTEKRKQRKQWYSSPFLTFEGGYQFHLEVLAAGINSDDTYLSIFLQLMKGPYDDLLQQSSHFPMYGYFVIELFSHAMGKSNCIRVLTFNERSCSECTNRVTKDTRAQWLGFYNFTSIESVYAHYLTDDDSLQFRITYTKYACYCKAMLFYSSELPNIAIAALADSCTMYLLLLLVEFVAFCIQKSNILIPTCIDFSIGSVEQFVMTKQDVLVSTGYMTLYNGLWTLVTFCAISLIEILLLAIGELILWDDITAMENVLLIVVAIERLRVVVACAMIVNQYVMSWGGKFTMIRILWLSVVITYLAKLAN